MRIATVLSLLAAAAASSPAAAQSSFAANFPARILAAHNAERARAGVPPLVWDNGLGTVAAGYATQMAMTGRFAHSDRSLRRGTGENLWMGTHAAFSVEAMVGGWASEKRFFTPGTFPNVSRSGSWEDVGHYTQMIWPTTARVGCALASTQRLDYLVCRYAGAGNIDGRPVGYAAR
ncbi:MAG: CAP domain-containing protein [Sphingomicrobium sp.]